MDYIYWRMDSEGARTKERFAEVNKANSGTGAKKKEKSFGKPPLSITKACSEPSKNLTSEDSFARLFVPEYQALHWQSLIKAVINPITMQKKLIRNSLYKSQGF